MMAPLLLMTLHLLNPAPSFWGAPGHRVVATLAEERLTPAARQQVKQLLGVSMAEVAPWADEIRTTRPTTAPWHFINLSLLDRDYRPERDCARSCIISALDSLIKVVGNPKLPQRNRAEALRFVIHLVGDLHQPLHVADRGDRGGNNLKIRALGRSTNLHSFWDSGVLNAVGWSQRALIDTLRKRMTQRKDLDSLARGSVVDWALEGRNTARDSIYALLPQNLQIDSALARRAAQVAEEQLLRGAVRLAALLNQTLPATEGKP